MWETRSNNEYIKGIIMESDGASAKASISFEIMFYMLLPINLGQLGSQVNHDIVSGFPSTLENLEKSDNFFQSGKSQGILKKY